MRLGVCYYPEQVDESCWQKDARMMNELGLKLVRIGEFFWSKIEPEPGKFDWGWLDRLINIMAGEGLQVVLATPSAMPPVWLVHQNPDILPVSANGIRYNFSAKHLYCANHPVFREHVSRIVTEMAKKFGSHPAVVGWQIDNEFGDYDSARCYCDGCAEGFREWLRKKYGNIDALNQSWGTFANGQQYNHWDQIFPPYRTSVPANPSYNLDYFRFTSESVVSFQNFQIDIVKQFSQSQVITHNLNYEFTHIDGYKLGEQLDFVSWDSSPTGHAEIYAPFLYAPWDTKPDFAYEVGDPYITGFFHALTRGFKNRSFWVMEQQCGQIDWGKINPDIRPGTLRLWTWHAIACGADAVLFDRWRATRFGNGQYQAGILQHNDASDLGHLELASMLREAPVMQQLKESPKSASVAIMVNFDDLWATEMEPHHQDYSYQRVVFMFYRAIKNLGISVDLISEKSDLSDYRLVISPSMFLVDKHTVNQLESYVARGGALVLGIRSGSKTLDNQFCATALPGALRSLVGAIITDWQALPEEIRFSLRSEIPGLSGEAGIWTEALRPEENEAVKVWARYMGGPMAGKAAITEHTFGAGAVFYLGFYPLFDQLKVIMRYIVETFGCGPALDLPEGVIIQQRGNDRVAFNFTRNEKTLVMEDKLVILPPRDFRFFLRDWS